jgi:hypothetical protein
MELGLSVRSIGIGVNGLGFRVRGKGWGKGLGFRV